MSSAMSSPTKSEFDEKTTGQAGLAFDEEKDHVDKEKTSSEPSSPSPQLQVLLKDDPHAHAHAHAPLDNTPLEHGHEPLPPAAEAVVDPILRTALATEIENGEPAAGIVLSPIRQTLLCAAMTLTYFIGSASGASVIFIIPAMSRDLGVSTLAAQWVASAQSLAWGW
ncbi:hypothetical protein JCM24511_03365 [Saitozyma sp. JCM 24511]|nr:hypothetical protein JCM24511_03365 [Saitozyma sp. JCM 24511]